MSIFVDKLNTTDEREHRQAKQHKEPKKQQRNQESSGRFFAMAESERMLTALVELKHYFIVLPSLKGVHSYIGRTSTVGWGPARMAMGCCCRNGPKKGYNRPVNMVVALMPIVE